MPEITKAIRWQNYIEVTYNTEPKITGQICIDAANTTRYKQISQTGLDCRVCFRFPNEAEAQKFLTAYLKDTQGKQITDDLRIVDIPLEEAPAMARAMTKEKEKSVRRDPIRTQEYRIPKTPYAMVKKWGMQLGIGLSIMLFTIITLMVMCSRPNPLQSFQIYEAFFQDSNTIMVLGRLEWHPTATEEQKASISKETIIQLWENNNLFSQKTVYGDSFQITLQYTGVPKANTFIVKPQYRGRILEENSKTVQFKSNYPLARIEKAEFTSQQKAYVKVDLIAGERSYISVQLARDTGNKLISIIDSKPLSENNEVFLGPISEYGQFSIILKNTKEERILEECQLIPTHPFAQISSAHFNNLNTCQIQGFWDGAKDIANLTLVIINSTKKSTVSNIAVEKSFFKEIALPDPRYEYEVQIVYSGKVLHQIGIIKPLVFQEYFQIVEDIPSYLAQTDRSFQYLSGENWNVSIKNLQEIFEKSRQYQQTCFQILPFAKDDPDVGRVQKLYFFLEQLAKSILEFNDTLSPDRKNELWAELLRTNLGVLQEYLAKIQNILLEFEQRPDIPSLFPYLSMQLQTWQKRLRAEKTMEYIHTCSQAGQYELAIDIATQAMGEYSELWQFLLARHQIYRILSQHPEYLQRNAWFLRKANEDLEKLSEIMRSKFQKLLAENNYSEAYIIGSYLNQLKPELAISQKLDEIKSKVPLDILINLYRKSLKVNISLESIGKNK